MVATVLRGSDELNLFMHAHGTPRPYVDPAFRDPRVVIPKLHTAKLHQRWKIDGFKMAPNPLRKMVPKMVLAHPPPKTHGQRNGRDDGSD